MEVWKIYGFVGAVYTLGFIQGFVNSIWLIIPFGLLLGIALTIARDAVKSKP